MGVSFGLMQKLFLSAFESAWAPFYYATTREAGRRRASSARSRPTAIAVLALLTAGPVGRRARSAAQAMTPRTVLRGADVAVVIAWTALGVFFQGVYLLTSIGLNITKQHAVLSGGDGSPRRSTSA